MRRGHRSSAAIEIGNTGKSNETPLDRQAGVGVPRAGADEPHARRPASSCSTRASVFIRTAVARKHLDSAWDLLGPEMKAGQTRKSWDTGNNNVVPFPAVGIATWNILYAYQNDVAIDLGVVGSTRRATGPGRRSRSSSSATPAPAADNWLVASWVPKGIGGAGQIQQRRRAAAVAAAVTVAACRRKWLLAPLGVPRPALVLGLAAWGIRSAVKQRRAAKRYAELLGYSSSSNPS